MVRRQWIMKSPSLAHPPADQTRLGQLQNGPWARRPWTSVDCFSQTSTGGGQDWLGRTVETPGGWLGDRPGVWREYLDGCDCWPACLRRTTVFRLPIQQAMHPCCRHCCVDAQCLCPAMPEDGTMGQRISPAVCPKCTVHGSVQGSCAEIITCKFLIRLREVGGRWRLWRKGCRL